MPEDEAELKLPLLGEVGASAPPPFWITRTDLGGEGTREGSKGRMFNARMIHSTTLLAALLR